MGISKFEDISTVLTELLTKNSDEDFEELQKVVGETPTENPWPYILLGGHFGHIGLINFLIDNKVGIILLISLLLIRFDLNFEGGTGSRYNITSDALKIVPTSVMFYYCVWYEI